MAGQLVGVDFVYAPHAIHDPTVERIVYGAGDPVPMPDAIRFGLVEAPEPPPDPGSPSGRRRGGRARKGPVEDRAHHHTEGEDR